MKVQRTFLLVASLVLPATLVAACAPPATSSPTPEGPQRVEITLSEFSIASSLSTFEAGVPYLFVITNAGAIEHELMIMPRGVTDHMAALLEVEEDELPSGATVEVEFTFEQGGEYEFACHVPGHYEAGMLLPITVSGGTSQSEEVASSPSAPSLDVANVARDPTDVPPPITRTEPTTVEITLTIKELTAELADGTSYTFWTFDGTVPGPMLRVMEGDTVILTLVNPAENSVGHNIDLHAVNGPGGGAAVTNVEPGESKTFSFKALNPGIYIYHCAYPPPWHHIAQGMYGAILVEPRGGLSPVDKEFYVVQGEWYTRGSFGEQGLQEFDAAKASAEQPEYFTFNGHTKALTEIYSMEAQVGERVRVFFGVGGPNVGSNWHIIGEIFDKVYTGAQETFVANEETWYVPPGSAAVFEFKVDVPGNYLLVDHALFRVSKGAAGVLTVTGEHDDSIYSPAP